MEQSTPWEFSDDRGRLVVAGNRPERIVAYIQAGATLWDHGIRPVGLFGSQHDGAAADPAKAGELPLDAIRYLGSGAALHPDTLLEARPDLVVAVTYDGEQVYGLAAKTARELEEQVPVAALAVGPGRSLPEVRERFAALAGSLGRGEPLSLARELDAAEDELRRVTGGPARPRVVALSPAGPEKVHLARPGTWPDLRALAEHGVELPEPAAGAGTNWSTVGWAEAAALAPDVVLLDVRANAARVEALRADEHWRAIEARARLLPWNPEAPVSRRAHTRFFTEVAEAVRAAAART
ncbi:ABC transporter substrate-binding protein [Streptomyces sp. NRRL F-4489]|uniref:ABC transporter substrate-binding protein n=1 Tax=Streptomyces sp. NRRL F-4489 TaxID=1609095 RepID=UPI000745F629|nr:ABC transporter substrate-binding protein [Streptomyces sp. NRRL F-4489]KUL36969.1 ABC transporter substrate-binding protein [Streptomyces sp. NRRL F-4489]